MRLTKSLLPVISALALATGAAFAGDGSHSQSMGSETDEARSLEQFSPMNDREALGYDERDWLSESDRLALSEPDVIYEEQTIVFTPSADNETPPLG
jgi:hypothetical protein